jgi:hypothetical protein
LNIVTKEEYGGKESEGCKIKSYPEGLLMYSEVPGLGSLLAKDKDAEVIFIQNNLFFIDFDWVCRLLKALFTYQTKDSPVKGFFRENRRNDLVLF